jgi:N4-(beta-N-acetylglucosaminyl)-L-asparaginase
LSNRRNFVKTTFAGLSAIALSPSLKSTAAPKEHAGPLVISTWNFGQRANAEAWKILQDQGRALDAVEQGVRLIESDPEERSVGYGGRPDRDGHVTLDACIMDEFSNCGSVAALEHIENPITVARMVMEKTPHVMLVGEGALQFALSQGLKKKNLLTPESEREWREWLKTSNYKPIANIENHDTIGMLALDFRGNLSGACTTSGMAYKMRGRVGDSPIIGAGLFVDNEVGAATATGVGEEVIRICGAHFVVSMMEAGKSPEEACRLAAEKVAKRVKNRDDVQVGFLAVNPQGQTGAFAVRKGFSYALRTSTNDTRLIAPSVFP